MKKLIKMHSLLFLTILSSNLHAKCVTDAVIIKHESGFGISFGSGGSKSNYGDSSMVNVPLTINGEQACFKKKSKFEVKTVEKNDFSKGIFTITPLDVEFENVPTPTTRQYIFADRTSHKTQTKFYTMSFICSGEIPLSIEASSDSYIELALKSEMAAVNTTTIIATGIAAKNLENTNYNSKQKEAFEFFADKYKLDTGKTSDTACCGQKVPSILTSTSVQSLTGIERAITSSFTTMSSYVPNGCENQFSDKMKNYLIENYEQNESLKDFKVSKGWFNKNLKFEWKNIKN
jgi:hypothetical protein